MDDENGTLTIKLNNDLDNIHHWESILLVSLDIMKKPAVILVLKYTQILIKENKHTFPFTFIHAQECVSNVSEHKHHGLHIFDNWIMKRKLEKGFGSNTVT